MIKTTVSTDWLNQHIEEENLIILDASSKTNKAGKTSEYADRIIPLARHFNIKENFSNQQSEFPNTFPTAKQFEQECRKLGINKSSQIVVYDNLGIYTSPRVWWMFRAMGHSKIAVLDGGLPEWVKSGLETEEKEIKTYDNGNFEARLQTSNVKFYEDILSNISSQNAVLIDVRSKGRFDGTENDPRKDLKSGHIPNSINIPYKNVLENGKYKSLEQLRELFAEKTLGNEDLIFSCGSGITACIVLLASELAVENNKSVYDGSWTEWATKQNFLH